MGYKIMSIGKGWKRMKLRQLECNDLQWSAMEFECRKESDYVIISDSISRKLGIELEWDKNK